MFLISLCRDQPAFENIKRLYEIWETKESIGTLLAIGVTFFSAVLEVFYAFETLIRYLAVRAYSVMNLLKLL